MESKKVTRFLLNTPLGALVLAVAVAVVGTIGLLLAVHFWG
jgi:hypothetical protein